MTLADIVRRRTVTRRSFLSSCPSCPPPPPSSPAASCCPRRWAVLCERSPPLLDPPPPPVLPSKPAQEHAPAFFHTFSGLLSSFNARKADRIVFHRTATELQSSSYHQSSLIRRTGQGLYGLLVLCSTHLCTQSSLPPPHQTSKKTHLTRLLPAATHGMISPFETVKHTKALSGPLPSSATQRITSQPRDLSLTLKRTKTEK